MRPPACWPSSPSADPRPLLLNRRKATNRAPNRRKATNRGPVCGLSTVSVSASGWPADGWWSGEDDAAGEVAGGVGVEAGGVRLAEAEAVQPHEVGERVD